MWKNKLLPCLALLLLGLLLWTNPAVANPFMAGRPSEMTVAPQGFMATPFVHEILSWQREIHEALTQKIEALKGGQDMSALWGLLLLGFFYGVFHVLAPGHSKTIVASYFLGNHAHRSDGIWAGLMMAIGHTITAVGFVVALNLILGLTQFGVLDKARYGELFGYGLISMIGGWLLWRSIIGKAGQDNCGCGHDHDHHHHGHQQALYRNRRAIGLFAATSLVPCTGSMIILLFTLANNVLWAGVLAVIAIALGMWLTVTVIGTVAIYMRQMIMQNQAVSSPWRGALLRGLNIIAALIVLLTGGLLFAGTLYGISS